MIRTKRYTCRLQTCRLVCLSILTTVPLMLLRGFQFQSASDGTCQEVQRPCVMKTHVHADQPIMASWNAIPTGVPSCAPSAEKKSRKGIFFFNYKRPCSYVIVSSCMRRPANHGQLENSIPIGVPSYVPSAEESGKGIFFVSMQELSQLSRASTVSSILTDISNRETPFPDLELGTLLGRGGYGSVYRGSYNGQECAVKVSSPQQS